MHQSNAGCAYPAEDPLRTITTSGGHALVAPTLIQSGYGERPGQAPRSLDLHRPLGTAVGGGVKHALVAAFLAKHYGGNYEGPGSDLQLPLPTITTVDHNAVVAAYIQRDFGHSVGADMGEPMPTITAGGGGHAAEVRAFLIKYYGADQDPQLGLPLHTITTKHRFGLVTVHGVDYQVVDIGMRMLVPRELFRAQSFPPGYVIDFDADGVAFTKEAQVRMCGNSVPPDMAEALVRAQFGEQQAREAA
jgi:DNA (cytosine-5)-methyltransferase 1